MKAYEPYFGYILIPIWKSQYGRSALETFLIGKIFKESLYTHAKNIFPGVDLISARRLL